MGISKSVRLVGVAVECFQKNVDILLKSLNNNLATYIIRLNDLLWF